MTVLSRYRLAAVAVSALLLGISGCGFAPATLPPEVAGQPQSTAPEAIDVASQAPSTSTEMVTIEEPMAMSRGEGKPTYRNPFRPPTVKARTLTPQQAESANIRLLGIAKRDSQHIALLETSGDFHKAIVGDFIEEWEVLSVTESETTLRRGLEQVSLRIR